MTPLIDKLSALDLPEKDASVYIALLKAGAATVQEIAKETGINRSSLYVILDRLMKSGFVNIASDKAVRKYAAAPPERLADAARKQAEQSTLLLQNLATLSPTLHSVHKITKFKPKVEVLHGKAGLQKGFEGALISKENIMRVFSSQAEIFNSLPDYLPTFIQKRMARRLKMKGIHPNDKIAQDILRSIPNDLDEITLIPNDRFKFPSDFTVFDDKVAFMSHKPAFATSIESKEIAAVMKVAFDLAQEEASRYGVTNKS